MSNDPIERDQEDIHGRLLGDEYLSDVAVLLQRKGVTESDIETALSVLNPRGEKLGACVIVLMPELISGSDNVPGPRHTTRVGVQVIENPVFNLSESGTGKSAESITTRVRQVVHHFANGTGGTFVFDSQEPIGRAAPDVSYVVKFRREGGDAAIAKVSQPMITQDGDGFVTITCATAGAEILYTIDGSYPGTENAEAEIYANGFAAPAGTLVRAAAVKAGLQQSNIAQLLLS